MASVDDVSIIIPTYCDRSEALDWFEEALASALLQGVGEVVVYDDGSPIGIDSVLARYRLEWPQLKSGGSATNKGPSHARNRAMLMVTKPLVLPLDCDDTLADGAVSELLTYWDGSTPVYTDIAKFGDEVDPHYTLLDFSCDNLRRYVGLASVNVLHLKSQWEAVGGWDKGLVLYEDGEYNARLFARYCAKRCPKPLINYRIHTRQRTQRYAVDAYKYVEFILAKIRSLDMPCASCGGGRKKVSSTTSIKTSTDPSTLPGTSEGRVLAQYIGGVGRGPHYYQGPSTKFMYRVTAGDYIYVDPSDVRGAAHPTSLLVQQNGAPVISADTDAVSTPEPIAVPDIDQPAAARTAVSAKPRNPVE